MFVGAILKRRNKRNVVPSNIVTRFCQFHSGMLLEPVSSTLERDLSLSLVMGVSGRQTVVVFDAVAELSLGSLLLLLAFAVFDLEFQ
jgi:hypothetical protein